MDENTNNDKKIICIKKQTSVDKEAADDNSTELVDKIGNAIVKNINENSTAYSSTFNSILMAWKDISVKTRETELEIAKLNAAHQRKMEEYQEKKNTISFLLDEMRRLQNQLESMNLNNLNEEEHKTYRFLLEQINNNTMALIKLYD